jgi:thioredoxin-like negative regulator of GroEL
MNKIVIFYSNSCEPCKYLLPILEKITKEKEIYLEKVSVDNFAGQIHSKRHEVYGWPTVYAVKDDIIIAEMMGSDPKGTEEQHRERIEEELFSKF